jgi:hypothetical protein
MNGDCVMVHREFLRELWRKKNFLTPIIIIISALLLHSAVFKSKGFMPKDDWCFILIDSSKPFHPQIENIGSAFTSFYGYAVARDMKNHGRFRPVYWILSTINVHLFRNFPIFWQLETLLIGIITCICFYFIAIRLHFSWVTSSLCSLWLLLRGKNLWVEKQLQETPGILFVMLAILFFIKGAKEEKVSKWDWFGLFFIALAGFTKESFILLIPAVIILRLTLSCCIFNNFSFIKTLKNLKGLILAFVLLFSLQLVVALLAYSQAKYSARVVGASPFDISILHWISMIKTQYRYLAYFLPALGIFFLIPGAIKNKLVLKRSLTIGSILLLWLIPQLMLYDNAGFHNHYFYPAIFALIIFNALGLEILKQMKLKISSLLFGILVIISLISMALTIPDTFNQAEKQIAVSNAFSNSTKQAIKSAKDNSAILFIPKEPRWGTGISYLAHIGDAGIYIPAFYDASLSRSKKALSNSRLLSRIYQPFKDEDISKIDIIITTYSNKEFLQKSPDYTWFKQEEWQVYRFPIKFKQLKFKIKKFLINYSLYTKQIEYCVFVREV